MVRVRSFAPWPSAAISLPPPLQRSQRPSIISIIDEERRPSDRQGVEVVRARRHVIMNKVSLQCNAFSQTRSTSAHGCDQYAVRCNSTRGIICQWSALMSDVLLFVVKDMPSARRLLQTWVSECSGLPFSHRPTVSIVVEDIGGDDESGDLTRGVSDNQSYFCFRSINVYRATEPSTGNVPDDVFSQVQSVRKSRQAKRMLWDWHTLFRVSRGLLQQLASAPESSPGTGPGVSYVSAFDMSRLPQPLKKTSPWLKDAWGEWIQQAAC